MELEEIRKARKKLDLTQKELAKLAGVSQSLIAKTETGQIDPSYSNAKRIFSALESAGRGKEEKISSFMVKKIISAGRNEMLQEAIRKMKRYGISQLPVFERGKVVGLVTETNSLEILSQGKDISKLKVGAVMEEAPPVIPQNTPKEAVVGLLMHAPIVLVQEKGRYSGVITKADLLKKL